MYRMLTVCIVALFVLSLAACAGKTPQPIAVQPMPEAGGPVPLASAPLNVPPGAPQPPTPSIVYDAFIELEVGDPYAVSERAAKLAERYGGYLVDSQSWRSDGQVHVSVTLAAPAPNYAALHADLLDLGKLLSEQVSGRWSRSYDSDWGVTSQITLRLTPASFAWPEFPETGWNPLRTASQAFEVFLTVFGFLADALIWLLVLVGPFVTLALIGRALIRRFNKP